MIRSFRDKEAEKVFLRERSRKLGSEVQRIAQRKLAMLDAAEELEKLAGDREGQHSLRVTTTSDESASDGRKGMRTMSRSQTTTLEQLRQPVGSVIQAALVDGVVVYFGAEPGGDGGSQCLGR
jgi:proteic killer suppression protein